MTKQGTILILLLGFLRPVTAQTLRLSEQIRRLPPQTRPSYATIQHGFLEQIEVVQFDEEGRLYYGDPNRNQFRFLILNASKANPRGMLPPTSPKCSRKIAAALARIPNAHPETPFFSYRPRGQFSLNPATLELVAPVQGADGPSEHVQFRALNGEIEQWSLGKEFKGGVSATFFCANGKFFFAGTLDGRLAIVNSESLWVSAQAHVGDPIKKIAAAEKANRIAVATEAGKIHFFEVKRRQRKTELETNEVISFAPRGNHSLTAFAFSPSGQHLAVALTLGGRRAGESVRVELRLYRKTNQRNSLQWEFSVLDGHKGPVHALTWSSDESTLFSGSSNSEILGAPDAQAIAWNVEEGKQLTTFESTIGSEDPLDIGLHTSRKSGNHGGSIYSLALSPDQKVLAAGTLRGLLLWYLQP